LYSLNSDLVESAMITDYNEKIYSSCENSEQINKLFTKCIVNLVHEQILKKSFELPKAFKSQELIYFNYAIAIKLMSSINDQFFTKDFGVNINKKHVLSFYLKLIKNDLMSKDVSATYDRLQAFIDLFIF